MLNRFLNNYFGFNKQQRNGLFFLISISFFLLIIRLSYPYFIKPDAIQLHNLPMIERVLDSSTSARSYSDNKKQDEIKIQRLFAFDPNKVSQKELVELGFTNKSAAVFIKFRSKGFVFKQKTDLKKVYGVSEKLYAQLEPFISIPTNSSTPHTTLPAETKNSETTAIKAVQTKFELNSVDSTDLISIHGIGQTYAKRILKYRSLLGGYVSIEQLKEVYGFNEELYLKVKDRFTVNASGIKKLNLNTDEFKLVNKHPYISYEICKSIFDWRKKTRITATNLKDILADNNLYQKLLPYLIFE